MSKIQSIEGLALLIGTPIAEYRAFGAPWGNRTPVSALRETQSALRRTSTNVRKRNYFNCLVRSRALGSCTIHDCLLKKS